MHAPRHATADTPLGPLVLVADDDALTGVYFPGHRPAPEPTALGDAVDLADDALLAHAADEVREYLDGRRERFDVPVRTEGDEFQERVWAILRDIPFGTTRTYGDIARELGNPGLARVVGRAVGRNPVSLIIPCHRVVGASGAVTGYAGGVDRKRSLLALEAPAAVDDGRLF